MLLPSVLIAAQLLSASPSAARAKAPASGDPGAKLASRAITAQQISDHIRYLASDALEGRAPGSAGDAKAQAYIAQQLEKAGLKPGAPGGGWTQPVELVGVAGHPDTLTIHTGDQSLTFQYQRDFMANSGTESGHSELANAELVFVGYGIVAPEFRWNDFKGADLKGKVLVVMNNDPEDDPALFAGKTRLWYGRWDYKYEQAAKVGAAGAIIIHTTPSAGYPWSVVQTSWAGEQFRLPHTAGTPELPVMAWSTEDAMRKIVALAGKDLDALRAQAEKREFQPVPLGVTVSCAFDTQVEKVQSANVIGVLPGSDPKLANEAVLYTAHHDHLGKRPGAAPGNDAIYNGAVDNASGVAELLAVARAYSKLPAASRPKRTIYFASVAAEEQGLLGSEYLAQHPPVPVGRIAADVNMDGANIWGRTRDVTAVGLGKSNLDEVIRQIAAEQGRVTKPDQFPDRGHFYRSDQFSFARLGVPSVYAESGLDYLGRPAGWGKQMREAWEKTHYHQPSDEWDPKWDLSGAVEDTQLYFLVGLRIANASAMPAWNKGDEFEAARLKSISQLTAAP